MSDTNTITPIPNSGGQVYAGLGEDPVMAAIRGKLSERLKTGFIELIPQETFDKMTDLAIEDFVLGPRTKRFKIESIYVSSVDKRNTTGKDGYIKVETPIDSYNVINEKDTLPNLIYLELVKLAKENITKTLNEDERFKTVFDNDVGNNIVPVLNTIVKDNVGAFVQALMGNIVNYTVGAAVNNMRSSNGMNSYIPPRF